MIESMVLIWLEFGNLVMQRHSQDNLYQLGHLMNILLVVVIVVIVMIVVVI